MKQSWLDKPHCMNCGGTTFEDHFRDYLDGHTLLEAEDICAHCGMSVWVFAYGSNENYTFTIRELLKNLAL